MEEHGFQLVRHKRGRGSRTQVPHLRTNHSASVNSDPIIDVDAVLRQLEQSRQELERSEFFYLFERELLQHCRNCQPVRRLVCLGLGSLTSNQTSLFQLQLLLCITSSLGLPADHVLLYDPVFQQADRAVIQSLGFQLEQRNLEAKYPVDEQSGTLFYLPHCARQLTNNLLWSNWSPDRLRRLIIIGNSFDTIVNHLSDRLLRLEGVTFLQKVHPLTLESKIQNSFRFGDVFNDQSIHSFKEQHFPSLSDPFWAKGEPPEYPDQSVEFIKESS